MPSSFTRRTPTGLRVLLLIVAVAVVAVLGNRSGRWIGTRASPEPPQGFARPSTNLNLAVGDAFPASALATGTSRGDCHLPPESGRPTLVLFLSPDCPPCVEALAVWSDGGSALPDPWRVVGICPADPDAVRIMTEEHAPSFPILSDAGQVFPREYGVRIYPSVMALSAGGEITFIAEGAGRELALSTVIQHVESGGVPPFAGAVIGSSRRRAALAQTENEGGE